MTTQLKTMFDRAKSKLLPVKLYNVETLDTDIKLPVNEDLVNKLFDVFIKPLGLGNKGVVPKDYASADKLTVSEVRDHLYHYEINLDQQENKLSSEYMKDRKEARDNFDKFYEQIYKKKGWTKQEANTERRHGFWDYVTSHKGDDPKRVSSENIKHRLYFNVRGANKWNLARILYEKLDKEKAPFKFKIANGDYWRPDSITWYIKPENLRQSLRILREIVKEHPELLSESHASPIMGQLYGGRVGYGMEPNVNVQEKTSYSKLICELFAQTLVDGIGKYSKGKKPAYKRGQIIKYVQDYISLNRNNPEFIKLFVKNFRAKLKNAGFNPDNMCFDTRWMNYTKAGYRNADKRAKATGR